MDFGAHTLTSDQGTAVFSNIEGAFGTNYDDTFIATDPTRVLSGLGNPNGNFDFTLFMQGFAGNDHFQGDSRHGYLETVGYGNAPGGVVVDLGAGTASDGYGTTDTLVDISGVQGSRFDDLLIGGGTGTIVNGLPFESFEGLAGNDTIVGVGTSSSSAAYFGAPSGVFVDLSLGIASDGYDADLFSPGVQPYQDVLIGVGGVTGSNFNDTIVGNDGSNIFDGRAGNDSMDGGAGVDGIFYFSATSAVDIDLALGSSGTTGGLGFDTWADVEWVRGGDFDDTLRGADGVDNVLEGVAGADLLDGRGGIDLVRYDRSLQGVDVDLSTGLALDGYGDESTDTLVSIERVRGSRFEDTITGDAGDNGLDGWAGDDTLDGGLGLDTAEYHASAGAVIVNLRTGSASDGWGGQDQLISIENVVGSAFDDHLTGNRHANLLAGNAGDDRLDGRSGSDTLAGGSGSDTLTGGGAADVFRFAETSGDVITDFDRKGAGKDALDLSDLATGTESLDWLVSNGYLSVDSSANVSGGKARDTVISWDADGSAGDAYGFSTVATLLDVALGTTGQDAGCWLV